MFPKKDGHFVFCQMLRKRKESKKRSRHELNENRTGQQKYALRDHESF